MYSNIYSKFKNIRVNTTVFNYLVLLVFVAVSSVGTFHHEMWRDELEAWLIAKDSFSIPDLLENLKYTGHPALWYLCLYFMAKITHDPVIMQLFNLMVVSGAVFIFLRHAPFNKVKKLLFCFSYFPLYEYGMISRSYGLGMLLVFIFCALFCKTKPNYLCLAITLVLLSHTHIYGLIIGFILAIMLAWTLFLEARTNQKLQFKQLFSVRQIGISLTIYLFGLFGAVIQIIPPANAQNTGHIANSISYSEDIFDVLSASKKALTGIWRSYAPLGSFTSKHTWNSNFLTDSNFFPEVAGLDSNSVIALILSVVLCLSFTLVFTKNLKVSFAYVTGILLLTMFGIIFKTPSLRHNGHLFIWLIVCLWIYAYELKASSNYISEHRSGAFLPRYQSILLTTILCFQLYGGLQMYAMDLSRVFSNSKNVAQYIKQNQLEKRVIIGSDFRIVFPIAAWLDKEIYYPEIQDFGTFTVWTPKSTKLNSDIGLKEIMQAKAKLKNSDYDSILLVLDWKIPETTKMKNLQLLASYKAAIVTKENYFIYSID